MLKLIYLAKRKPGQRPCQRFAIAGAGVDELRQHPLPGRVLKEFGARPGNFDTHRPRARRSITCPLGAQAQRGNVDLAALASGRTPADGGQVHSGRNELPLNRRAQRNAP